MKLFSYISLILLLVLAGCGNQKKNNIEINSLSKDTSITEQKKDSAQPDSNSSDNSSSSSINNNSTITSNNDFIVLSATSQQWHGGIKGSGGGTNYDICLRSFLSSSQLIIDKLWISETYFDISASRKFPKTSADGFFDGDTLYIHASEYRKDTEGPKLIDEGEGQKDVQDDKIKTPPPYKYREEALIGYKINGTRKYKEIAKITVKQPLFYP